MQVIPSILHRIEVGFAKLWLDMAMKVFNKWTYQSRSVRNVNIDVGDMFCFVTKTSKFHQISNAIKNISYLLLAFLLAPGLFAAPLTIIPNAPGNLVTAGIPFAACVLPDVSQFKLLNEAGTEIPIFIKPTLFWPASKCNGVATVRAIKIQFAYDAAQRQKVYDWQLASRSMPALAEAPIEEVVSDNPARAPYKEPAFFAINDPAYLVTTGLIPPTTAAGDNDYDKVWYPASFAKRVSTINFATTVGENWLFDPVSTIYQQAIRSGSPEQYREAYLEHEFYMSKFNVVDVSTIGIGRQIYAPGDVKYVYLSPMKLHLALTGDDSWTPQENGVPHATAKDRDTFLRTIVSKALTYMGIGKPYLGTNLEFTERDIGFAFQQVLVAAELLNDPIIYGQVAASVGYLHDMQTNNPDGQGNYGYLSHSWDKHEGYIGAYVGASAAATTDATTITVTKTIGNDWEKLPENASLTTHLHKTPVKLAGKPVLNEDGTLTFFLAQPATLREGEIITGWANNAITHSLATDRAFSPWMQAIVADGLWQLYNLTEDTALRAKTADLLLGFGRAVTAYGIDGQGMSADTKTKIQNAFSVQVTTSNFCCGRGIVPYTRYVSNALLGRSDVTSAYIGYISQDGDYSDQHSAEALFQVSLGIRFETDPAKKDAMLAVAKELTAWFSSANTSKTILSSHPARYFNWSNKQNAWGTYEAIETGEDAPEMP